MVVVDDNRLPAFLCECPCTMYGTEVELDTLSDTDRTGSENENLLLWLCLNSLILASEYTVVIWCLCCELSRTGINHLVCCNDSVRITHLFDLFLGLTGESCDHVIRELNSLCFL